MSYELPNPICDRWALLVGVNRYIDPAFPSLKFCVKDVLALEQALKDLGYTVVCLHDELNPDNPRFPTRDNIEAELAQLCQSVGQDDLLMVHFACHGQLVAGQPVLISRETRASMLVKKALPLADVEKQMRESKARRLVLTLDACHTGVEIGRGVADPEFIRNAYELAEGFALIAASTAQQKAQEWQEKEHGVFTYYLLEGLSGKADRDSKEFVTVNDLQTHVLSGLRRWNVQHGGLIQEPTARAEGLGDMILADYRGRLGAVQIAGGGIAPNPFGDTGKITDPKRFFGREELLRQLFEELDKGCNRSLVGDAQVGKSSILEMVCQLGPERLQLPSEAFIYLDMRNVYNEQEFFEYLCDELRIEACRGYKLKRALRGKQYILCLDEIDNMASEERFTGQERTELCGLADGADVPFTLVTASQKSLKDLFPDSPLRTSPLAGICQQIDVGPFSADEARRFLNHRLEGTGVSFSESQIQELIAESRGYPGSLQQLAAHLYRGLVMLS